MNLKDLCLEYFSSCKLMQLATVNENNPWICNVYFVIDESLNIYWTSSKIRQHSKDILANPNVAVSVVKDPDNKQALQITGNATIVSLDDASRVDKLYSDKFGENPGRLTEVMANNPDGRAYWQIIPTSIFFWDEVNFPQAPKQELKLSK